MAVKRAPKVAAGTNACDLIALESNGSNAVAVVTIDPSVAAMGTNGSNPVAMGTNGSNSVAIDNNGPSAVAVEMSPIHHRLPNLCPPSATSAAERMRHLRLGMRPPPPPVSSNFAFDHSMGNEWSRVLIGCAQYILL